MITFLQHDRDLYTMKKGGVGVELNSGETWRERDRVLLRKGYGMGNKLDHWR